MTRPATDSQTAVILAGGKGTRLRPYTASFPKPLMPVGDKPILDIVVGQLARAGFRRLFFAVGHLAELIRAYFGDGSRWDVEIAYVPEEEPLGTAGPLRAMSPLLPPQFLVLNGDVLCDLNFDLFMAEHRRGSPPRLLTISTHRRLLRSEYGVLSTSDEGLVLSYEEKPTWPLHVSEGVYAFSREVLERIPEGKRMDFPELVNVLLANGEPVAAREHRGLWLDIGRPEDYDEAQRLMAEHPEAFGELRPVSLDGQPATWEATPNPVSADSRSPQP